MRETLTCSIVVMFSNSNYFPANAVKRIRKIEFCEISRFGKMSKAQGREITSLITASTSSCIDYQSERFDAEGEVQEVSEIRAT
jgi:hypothetical protein